MQDRKFYTMYYTIMINQ